jgi:periplasmic protein TonB
METEFKNLDDLIFKDRNKAYGAYKNRKNYKNYLFWAMLGATGLFLTVVSAPLIANYINKVVWVTPPVTNIADTMLVVDNSVKPPDLPPEPPKAVKAEPTFTIPKVVSDTTDLTGDITALIDNTDNRKIGDTAFFNGDGDTTDTGHEVIEIQKPKDFLIVEEMPEFPGGDEGRLKFLSANIKYPQIAKETGIQGPVYVSFVVDETGKVVDVNVLRGIGAGCDEEAARVVESMPRWKPGRQSGQEVRVKFSMALNFRLE